MPDHQWIERVGEGGVGGVGVPGTPEFREFPTAVWECKK